MYSNTTLLSICQCFESNLAQDNTTTTDTTDQNKVNCNNLCSLKFIKPKMETRRYLQPKSNRDYNFNNQFNTNNYRTKQTFEERRNETSTLRTKFPTKVPIMVTRYAKEKNLPNLDKSKFLVPQEITLSQFLIIIRHRMAIRPTEALYLLVNDRTILSLSCTLAQAYQEYHAKDGFLYFTYASQAVFGSNENSTITNLK